MNYQNKPEAWLRLQGELQNALDSGVLKKAVMSKPRDRKILRALAEPFLSGGECKIKITEYLRDGKAIQKIILSKDAPKTLCDMAFDGYGEINLVANGKTLTLMISEKGKTHFVGNLDGAKAVVAASGQDKSKNYILTPECGGEFLSVLGITDQNGRVRDKKQAKYRQINKFLEQIKAVEDKLPKDGRLTVCDLCCGKSYLTFAVYWYFTTVLGREVDMYGVDLKPDVIEFCTELKNKLGWSGMSFSCGDVSKFTPPSAPDLVISLHACDVATDYVLLGAVKNGARVILSTPCCQHELNSKMKCKELSFLTEHSVLKQKLASAATDALRAKYLEIHGYSVTVCEFIDPEETPKNVLIRAVKRSSHERTGKSIPALTDEYQKALELLGVKESYNTLLFL